MNLKCDLCNLEFKNDDQLNQHVSGKKHKKLESLKEEREKSARRSLFVSNLKKDDTFVKHIETHFEQFGKIAKTVIDSKKNSYAIVEFEDESSVDKALETKEHKINGKTLKISRRELKEFVCKANPANSDAEKKEIIEKLKQEALNVNTILGKCDSLDDQVDKLIDYLKLDDDEMKKREVINQQLNRTFKSFWPESEAQVDIFGSTKNGLACKGSDLDLTLLIASYLTENRQKQQVMPKIVAKQLNRSKPHTSKDSSNSNSTDDVESMEEVVEEEVSEKHVDNSVDLNLKECVVKFFNNKEYGQLIKFDVEIQVKIVARIIQRFSQDIKSLKTITNARCPVVRFFNDLADINCDLSINNYLACENTKLIRLYMDLEPILTKLIFVLRYWFKQKNLYGGSKFNSYTIICMIVFYMQTRKIGYLPTVESLASLTANRNEIHGWNCSYETDLNKIKSNRPKDYHESSEIDSNKFNDVLKGFFEFYSHFLFKCDQDMYRVLNTRSCEIVNVKEDTPSPNQHLSKLSKYINIQDPFDLSHNLSVNVSKNTLERFQSEARGSNELLHYGREPRKSSTKGWGLILLMTKKSLPVLGGGPISMNSRSKLISLSIDHEFATVEKAQEGANFAVFLFKDCLLFEQLSQEQINSKKRKRAKLMSQICSQVDNMGIEGSNNSTRSPTKRAKMTVSTSSPHDENNNESLSSDIAEDDDDEDEDSIEKVAASEKLGVFTLSARGHTWIGRRSVKRDLKNHQESLGELQLESLCSSKLMEKHEQCSKEVDFKCEFVFEADARRLNMKFTLIDQFPSQSDLVEFDTLAHFLHVFVNTSMEKGLIREWLAKQQHA